MDNKTLILNEFEKHKGEFVITDNWDVQRLVAIGSDNWDYYYVMYDGRKFTWFTCVGWFIPLKGKIDNKYYNEFIRIAKLNSFDQVTLWGHTEENEKINERKVAIQEHKTELMKLTGSNKFLTEVCWDLN